MKCMDQNICEKEIEFNRSIKLLNQCSILRSDYNKMYYIWSLLVFLRDSFVKYGFIFEFSIFYARESLYWIENRRDIQKI